MFVHARFAAAMMAAAAFVIASGPSAHADPRLFTPNEEQWLNHIENVLGIPVHDPVAAVHTGYQICLAVDSAPNYDVAQGRIDGILANAETPLNSIQRTAIGASALQLLCPNGVPAGRY